MESDRELVEKSRKGSHEAFECLMVRYQRLLYRIAHSFTREKEEAMDLCQEAFLLGYQKIGNLSNPDKFKSWMIRLTYNLCLTWHQGQTFQLSSIDDDFEAPAAKSNDPDQRHFLERCIELLNPKQKLAVVLKYLEGYSYSELAQVLEVSEDTAKNLIYRSIQKMSNFAKK